MLVSLKERERERDRETAGERERERQRKRKNKTKQERKSWWLIRKKRIHLIASEGRSIDGKSRDWTKIIILEDAHAGCRRPFVSRAHHGRVSKCVLRIAQAPMLQVSRNTSPPVSFAIVTDWESRVHLFDFTLFFFVYVYVISKRRRQSPRTSRKSYRTERAFFFLRVCVRVRVKKGGRSTSRAYPDSIHSNAYMQRVFKYVYVNRLSERTLLRTHVRIIAYL